MKTTITMIITTWKEEHKATFQKCQYLKNFMETDLLPIIKDQEQNNQRPAHEKWATVGKWETCMLHNNNIYKVVILKEAIQWWSNTPMMNIKKIQRTKPRTNIHTIRLTTKETEYLQINDISFSKLVHETIRILNKNKKVTKWKINFLRHKTEQ